MGIVPNCKLRLMPGFLIQGHIYVGDSFRPASSPVQSMCMRQCAWLGSELFMSITRHDTRAALRALRAHDSNLQGPPLNLLCN